MATYNARKLTPAEWNEVQVQVNAMVDELPADVWQVVNETVSECLKAGTWTHLQRALSTRYNRENAPAKVAKVTAAPAVNAALSLSPAQLAALSPEQLAAIFGNVKAIASDAPAVKPSYAEAQKAKTRAGIRHIAPAVVPAK